VFPTFQSRLHLYGIDLRLIPVIEKFVLHISQHYPKLDILVNNACQTVRRPTVYYKHLIPDELLQLQTDEKNIKCLPNNFLPSINSSESSSSQTSGTTSLSLSSSNLSIFTSQISLLPEDSDKKYFPPGLYDADHQQLDLRSKSSWNAEVSNVSTIELLETQIINFTAPFLLIRDLTPRLLKNNSGEGFSYIINVSSMEGRFDRNKTSQHPHLNAAKAGLNMITRTCGQSSKSEHHICMLSVDTGWQNNYKVPNMEWRNPLDYIDGAARILDPIFSKSNLSGVFLKDYKICTW